MSTKLFAYGNEVSSGSNIAANVIYDLGDGQTSNVQEMISELKAGEINTSEKFFGMIDPWATEVIRRNIYRGKNLGNVVTDEQKANIRNGSFRGFFVGDFWDINGVQWDIADINYWYNCGDTPFTKTHLVIMPREPLYNTQMNETDTTEGGYTGSAMFQKNLGEATKTIVSIFGDALLLHREYLVNAVSNGKPSGGAWYSCNVDLPNECMMYGHPHFTPANDGSTVPALYTISRTQLSLFALRPSLIANRSESCWLRDTVSSRSFAIVGGSGYANANGASDSHGVRPVFPIG